MKSRFVKRFLPFVLIAGLAMVSVIALAHSLPATSSQAIAKPSVDSAVAKAALEGLWSGAENSPQQPTIKRTTVVQNYAIATWLWGETGGQSILIKQQNYWQVLGSGGGSVDLAILQQKGIPDKIAKLLIQREQSAQKR